MENFAQNIDGAILFRCGDSRNGGMYKAVKKHFGWLPSCRIKTFALAGGAHSKVSDKFVVNEVSIYTKALLRKGATNIALIISSHDDCGFVVLVGENNLEKRWLSKKFTDKLFLKIPELACVHLMHVGYKYEEKPVVPSFEVKLTTLGTCTRKVEEKLKAA